MTKNFHGSPINNPASGNILFLSTTTNGLYLHEVDPSRSYVQVASAPVLSADLRSRILTKYNATVTGVGTVWNLAAGTNGPTKEQVAVVIDLKIVEAATPMRVVIGWQLSNDAFHLDFVTTPPSGADFACDVSNFQSADGLLFIAGYSPKGACIFISKPAAREAWSANFLTGSGSVAVMSVTPTKPYLVIGLADGTVTVWTYASALIRSAATTKILKRWLFPLCRLDCETSLAKETPVNAGIDTDDSHSDNRSK